MFETEKVLNDFGAGDRRAAGDKVAASQEAAGGLALPASERRLALEPTAKGTKYYKDGNLSQGPRRSAKAAVRPQTAARHSRRALS